MAHVSKCVYLVLQSKSDSFYFVNNKLVMHTKASYGYTADA